MFTITATKNLKRRLGGDKMGPQKVQRIMSTLPDRMCPKAAAVKEEKPDITLQNLLYTSKQMKVDCPSYSELPDFFHAPTKEEIEAYQHDLLTAVRGSKIDTLREFMKQGRPMKCSNEFGESILHLACRKGLTEVAKFLITEAKVPVQVCDDYGRNPLHDACWVHKPNFELMDLVLKECPDLLYIKDRRGHTPLAFARKDQWKEWNDYLRSRPAELLTPKKLTQTQTTSPPASASSAKAAVPGPATAALAGPASAALAGMGGASAGPSRPSPQVAKSGIKIPMIAPKVASSGIRIPIIESQTGLSVLLKAASIKPGQLNNVSKQEGKVSSAPGPATAALLAGL